MTGQSPTLFITGATGCLGKALAIAALPFNPTLILHGRNADKLSMLDDEIQALSSTKTLLWPADFTLLTDDNLLQYFQNFEHHLQQIDFFFNCATDSGQQMPLLQENNQSWTQALLINCNQPRNILKFALPLLQASPNAGVYFFDEQLQQSYQGSYGMSKHMLHYLIDQLTKEFQNTSTITCNMLKLPPLCSALRAKRFPGENPSLNQSATQQANKIISTLMPRFVGH